MKVSVDLGLCQGHQMCQVEAPDVFDFDEDTDQVVLKDEHPDDALLPQVVLAVKYCPAMAIAVTTDPEKTLNTKKERA
jgi:ferredoxin